MASIVEATVGTDSLNAAAPAMVLIPDMKPSLPEDLSLGVLQAVIENTRGDAVVERETPPAVASPSRKRRRRTEAELLVDGTGDDEGSGDQPQPGKRRRRFGRLPDGGMA
jgi:hypothetical protein